MNAILAAILSLIIPGLGQALSGDVKKGIMFFVGAIVLGVIVAFIFRDWLASIINIAYAVYVAYNAYLMNQ